MAEAWLNAALSICDKYPEDTRSQRLDVLFSLCKFGARSNIQPSRVLSYAQEHLKICNELNDDSITARENIGMSHSNLGMAYLFNNQFALAAKSCRISVETDLKLPEIIDGSEWPHFAYAYLGWALIGLNKPSEAVEELQRTLKWRENKFGKHETQSIKLAYTLHPLGNAYAMLGKEEASIKAYQRALKIYESTTDENYFRVAQVRVKLAEHHINLRQNKEAL
jgi:tetratricopeptide (TPR) repeat protein